MVGTYSSQSSRNVKVREGIQTQHETLSCVAFLFLIVSCGVPHKETIMISSVF